MHIGEIPKSCNSGGWHEQDQANTEAGSLCIARLTLFDAHHFHLSADLALLHSTLLCDSIPRAVHQLIRH